MGPVALNRTIVGWKLKREVVAQVVVSHFKSHHSGMETDLINALIRVNPTFKSHHSGMETSGQSYIQAVTLNFKSHHSGMETIYRVPYFPGRLALNRTIVGWKQVMKLAEQGKISAQL